MFINRIKVCAFVAALLLAGSASAAVTETLESTFVTVGPSGTIGSPQLAPLTLTTSGTLTISASPFNFGASLSTLSLAIVDASGHRYGAWSGTGSGPLQETLSLDAGTYYALSSARTQGGSGASAVGFYGCDVGFTPGGSPSPVPLPDALLLLGSALALIAVLGRRTRHVPGGPGDAHLAVR